MKLLAKLSSADKAVLDELWLRKEGRNPWLPESLRIGMNEPGPYLDWMGVVVAKLTEDVTMHVWNGRHPPDKNMTDHVAKKGATVLVWMMSRFGDIGITDRMDAQGYDARVAPTTLVNWRFR